jgi:hypothetical protein
MKKEEIIPEVISSKHEVYLNMIPQEAEFLKLIINTALTIKYHLKFDKITREFRGGDYFFVNKEPYQVIGIKNLAITESYKIPEALNWYQKFIEKFFIIGPKNYSTPHLLFFDYSNRLTEKVIMEYSLEILLELEDSDFAFQVIGQVNKR